MRDRVREQRVTQPVEGYPFVFFIPPLPQFDAINTPLARDGYLPNGRRFDGQPEIAFWCEDQFGPEGAIWTITGSACHIAFSNGGAATAFKLRWCSPI